MEFEGFFNTVQEYWNSIIPSGNSTKDITAHFKNLRQGLKRWSRNLSKHNSAITNCRFVLTMLDGIEEQRLLTRIESNLRRILKLHTHKLLEPRGSIGNADIK